MRGSFASKIYWPSLDSTVYAQVASTIDRCWNLFDCMPFRLTKAAVKMHKLLDLQGASCVHPYQHGKREDFSVLDILLILGQGLYVMDRGYLDFSRLYKMHQLGNFFVTREYHQSYCITLITK